MTDIRIGHGYDVHRFSPDRKLILGGVEIEWDRGLLGHSDADVLCHAVSDAILGAMALGDIGKHFPDTDPKYKGADSIKLLEHCVALIGDYRVSNLDVTVIAQKPKLACHIEAMRQKLASAVKVDISRISIKATTEEGLGFTGALEGISCHAVALLIRD